MNITYKNSFMVVEHNSGHIDRYNEQHLLDMLTRAEKRKADVEREIININKHIEGVKTSFINPLIK